ncbi:alpha/beta fold hydrolase [Specibacter cremeus]|uniref:alpha/beta fold hydrolase n=1 Tax=Specibacter cremeus TaxID=1629051 RepID=UPI000F783615|nr:alpha/beta fold hydrolase [Specibacter cremeus]
MDGLIESPALIEVRQSGFDPLGPTVRQATAGSGRTVNYIDEGGPRDGAGIPLLFLGGAGTTVRAFGLMEFARSFRHELGIRVISVERNGLGQTPFDPAVGLAEYAFDVWSVLDGLDVDEVSIVAISGGGPYAARLAASHPDRVRSLHLACAYAESIGDAGARFEADQVAADPVAWWRFPAESAVHHIPGFDDSVIEEAVRGVFALGRDVPPHGLAQAFSLYAGTPLPSLAAVAAPVFMYWGTDDTLVPVRHMARWRRALGERAPDRPVVERLYPGEGHDVQYRHWDQILVDVAHQGDRLAVTLDGRTFLAAPGQVAGLRAQGATLGLAPWA